MSAFQDEPRSRSEPLLSTTNTNDAFDNSSNRYYIVRSAQSSLMELQRTTSGKPTVMNANFAKGAATVPFGDRTYHRNNIDGSLVSDADVAQQSLAFERMRISHPTPPSMDYFSQYAPAQNVYIPDQTTRSREGSYDDHSADRRFAPAYTRQQSTSSGSSGGSSSNSSSRAVHTRPSMMHNQSAWRPHDRFYFQDGNVVFRIGNILYNLHRHLFETQSTFFANLFSALLLPNQQTQKDPIVLSELKTVDFDRFLSVLYPSAGIPPPKSKEGLLSVLGLATQWGFASVRAAAVQGLGQVLSREERAMYASKLQVREWAVVG